MPSPGLILYGEPGCGKSTCAKRIAVNGKAAFLQLESADALNHLMGKSEKIIRAHLQACLQHDGPIVLLLDEVDGLLPKQTNEHNISHVATFKECANENDLRRNKVVIVATTNHVDRIDSAVISRLNLKKELTLPEMTTLISTRPIGADRAQKQL